jgi:hypothetical protein
MEFWADKLLGKLSMIETRKSIVPYKAKSVKLQHVEEGSMDTFLIHQKKAKVMCPNSL